VLVYDSKGEYDKAIEYYTKSLAILKILGGEHSKVAISYNKDSRRRTPRTSICRFILLEYRCSSTNQKKTTPNPSNTYKKQFTSTRKSEERDDYVLAIHNTKRSLCRTKPNRYGNPCTETGNGIGIKIPSEMGRDKDAFTERFLYVFKDLLKLYLESEQLEKALEVSEKMSGLSISENFNLKYALSHGGVLQDPREKLLKLRSELESLGSERIAAKRLGDKGKQREEELWKRIRTTEQEANTLDKELIRTMPIYAQLRKTESPTITALQRQLKKSRQDFLRILVIYQQRAERNPFMHLSLAPKASSL
jgi:tetratricopeptide (TPR) repeat protein